MFHVRDGEHLHPCGDHFAQIGRFHQHHAVQRRGRYRIVNLRIEHRHLRLGPLHFRPARHQLFLFAPHFKPVCFGYANRGLGPGELRPRGFDVLLAWTFFH